MANTTTPKDENLYSIKSWLWHCTVNNATQSVSGGNPAKGTVCIILCIGCSTAAQADQKGSALPNQKQMDSRIQV